MAQKNGLTEQQKSQIKLLHEAGQPIVDIARGLCLSGLQVAGWISHQRNFKRVRGGKRPIALHDGSAARILVTRLLSEGVSIRLLAKVTGQSAKKLSAMSGGLASKLKKSV